MPWGQLLINARWSRVQMRQWPHPWSGQLGDVTRCYLESSSVGLSQSQLLWDLLYTYLVSFLSLSNFPIILIRFFSRTLPNNLNEWCLPFTTDLFIQQIFTILRDSCLCLTMTQTRWIQKQDSVPESSIPWESHSHKEQSPQSYTQREQRHMVKW